jgi:crossover junction endodeoxyribonuclease RusA
MIEITLPWAPSVNDYWRHVFRGKNAGRVYISEGGKAYREAVRGIYLEKKSLLRVPAGILRVEILAFVPDRRRRDLDNQLKAIFDSITYAGMWEDDSLVDDYRIRRARKPDGSLIIGGMHRITITSACDAVTDISQLDVEKTSQIG